MDGRTVAFRIRLLAVLSVVAANTALYLWINAHPTRAPALLPVTPLDQAIGWHAWTVWPYWLLLCVNPLLALGIRDRGLLWSTLKAYAIAMGLDVAIWLAWPTRILRAPLPEGLEGATRAAWELLYALDEPNTCFPSGHITIPVVVMFAVARQYPGARPWTWLPVLLFPTILTTGQHHAVDLFAGAATGLLGLAATGLLPWRRSRPAMDVALARD